MTAINLEIIITLGLLVLAAPCVAHSYISGGLITNENFRITLRIAGKARTYPGYIGDLITATMIFGAFCIITWKSPNVVLIDSWGLRFLVIGFYFLFLFINLRYRRYTIKNEIKTAVDKGKPLTAEQEGEVRNSYKFYIYYSTLIFVICLFCVLKIFAQFWIHSAGTENAIITFSENFNTFMMAENRLDANGDFVGLLDFLLQYKLLYNQIFANIELIVFMSIYVAIVNVSINSSFLRGAFRPWARVFGQLISLIFVLSLIFVTLFLFYGQFTTLTNTYSLGLNQALNWSFKEVENFLILTDSILEVQSFQGIGGAFRLFSSQGGLIVLFATFGQWLIARLSESQEQKKSK